jgi:hypothetical protein
VSHRLAARCAAHTARTFVCMAFWLASGVLSPATTHAAEQQHDDFWLTSTPGAFHGWSVSGAVLHSAGTHAGVALRARPHTVLPCSPADIDGGQAQPDPVTGLCIGHDPVQSAGRYYNGSRFWFGTLVSPVHRTVRPIDQLIASWNAATPDGTWLEVHVRLLEPSGWTRLFRLPIWASGSGTIRRHSVNHQITPEGRVDTDTVMLPSTRLATAYQLRITLFTARVGATPLVHLFAATASRDSPLWPAVAPDRAAWGTDLVVPQRSQMAVRFRGLGYGGGGEAWCSATSTSMVLAYWAKVLHRPGLNRSVPEVARSVYDATYDGTGNWPFNTAYAGEFGLTAYVVRLDSMSALEHWILSGVPIVISVAFGQGDLPGEPIGASDGHLMVVRGFTHSGDVVTNDPAAASDSGVRLIFNRAALERVWRNGSHGTAYVMYPAGWSASHRSRINHASAAT